MKITLIAGLAGIFTLASCRDEVEPIPAYLHIPDIMLTTNPGEGSASENIGYAWVYIENEFLGGYQLPITFPVLAQGETRVIIDSGVRENGIGLTPVVYPFYQRITIDRTLIPARIDTIRPTTTYRNSTIFAFVETFESSNHLFTDDLDEDPLTRIELTDQGSFEGKSAFIRLENDHPLAIIGSNFDRIALENLPKQNVPVWLEVDYKTEIPLIFGLTAFDQEANPTPFPEFGINPRLDWNKIYFNLTPYVQNVNFVAFQIFIQADLPTDKTTADVYLDNIKVLHF